MTYLWQFGDGSAPISQSSPNIQHTYTALGTYVVNVTASNIAASSRSENFIVTVQSTVGTVTVTSERNVVAAGKEISFDLSVATGTDYICKWSLENNVTKETTSEETPVGSTNNAMTHIFTNDGKYKVEVECGNGISKNTGVIEMNVYEEFDNFRLDRKGALINVAFVIEFGLDSSPRDATVEVRLDGTLLTMSSDDPLKTISISGMSKGTYWLNAEITNPVSNAPLVLEFVVDTDFEDPSTHLNKYSIEQGEEVDIEISTTEGSSIHVDINYGDGTDMDTYFTGNLQPWPVGYTVAKTHAYRIPGIFNLTVSMYNGYREFIKTYIVKVYNRVEGKYVWMLCW